MKINKDIKKTVRISYDTYQQICLLIENRMTYSRFINIIIDDFLNNQSNIDKLIKNNAISSNINKIYRKTIYLNNKEFDYLATISKKNYLSVNAQIRKILASNIDKKTLLNFEELNTLNNLNKQLIKLGTNVDSISKYYNKQKYGIINLNESQEEYLKKLLDKTNSLLQETKNTITKIKLKCL
ncbi:MAG: hypothetical protein GKC53_05355 [Neisseriaceae bacterium]|nr:MAG: hypothetical protein GKC53_05355 [Neisseriaceae bacterium]